MLRALSPLLLALVLCQTSGVLLAAEPDGCAEGCPGEAPGHTGKATNSSITYRYLEKQIKFLCHLAERALTDATGQKKWFDELRSRRNCTQFVHDVLDIVEEKMLVVLSESKSRVSSAELHDEFDKIHKRCLDESQGESYCLTEVATPIQVVGRQATGVVANLNLNAIRLIERNEPRLSTYEGTAPHRPMSAVALANTDAA